MFLIEPPIRMDAQGSGKFGVSRDGGWRKHNGIDYAVMPGSLLVAPVSGLITKYGFPYKDANKWRYVEITSDTCQPWGEVLLAAGICKKCKQLHYRHRFFYCEKLETYEIGDRIKAGSVFAVAKDISEKYPGMMPHIHYEIMQGTNYLDPQIAISNDIRLQES